MTFSYDKRADVLYVSFATVTPADYYVSENENGDVLKISRSTGQVVGCVIPSFVARSQKGTVPVPGVGDRLEGLAPLLVR